MLVYFNEKFIPKQEAMLSVDDRGFLFADGAYEVVRSYNGNLFYLDDHLKRLSRSLRQLQIADIKLERIEDIAKKLIDYNGMTNKCAILYLQVTRGVAPRQHSFPKPSTPPTVYISTSFMERPINKFKKGVKVILVPDERWMRCDIKSIGLTANVMANQMAKDNGAEEAVFVRDGFITEGSHTNFCGVFDGQLITPSEDNFILSGITRKIVLSLCKDIGIPCREHQILAEEIKKFTELIIIGTTVEITPVIQIDQWEINSGKPGPLTRQLQDAFNKMLWK